MKRFLLSAFSVVLAAGAVAPAAQALPQVDPAFKLQTLRLSEFDTRNKSEDYQQTYGTYEQQTYGQQTYGQQTYEQQSLEPATPQNDTSWEEQPVSTEPTTWENAEEQSEAKAPSLSLLERRHEFLDRRN